MRNAAVLVVRWTSPRCIYLFVLPTSDAIWVWVFKECVIESNEVTNLVWWYLGCYYCQKYATKSITIPRTIDTNILDHHHVIVIRIRVCDLLGDGLHIDPHHSSLSYDFQSLHQSEIKDPFVSIIIIILHIQRPSDNDRSYHHHHHRHYGILHFPAATERLTRHFDSNGECLRRRSRDTSRNQSHR